MQGSEGGPVSREVARQGAAGESPAGRAHERRAAALQRATEARAQRQSEGEGSFGG